MLISRWRFSVVDFRRELLKSHGFHSIIVHCNEGKGQLLLCCEYDKTRRLDCCNGVFGSGSERKDSKSLTMFFSKLCAFLFEVEEKY